MGCLEMGPGGELRMGRGEGCVREGRELWSGRGTKEMLAMDHGSKTSEADQPDGMEPRSRYT